jgi:hypothetical protein
MIDPEKASALQVIEGSLHRMAMKMLDTPASEREAAYKIMRQNLKEASDAVPIDEGFEDEYMKCLRALVLIIESGGGGKGGTA